MIFFNILRRKQQLLNRADTALNATHPTGEDMADIAGALRKTAVRDALATRITDVPHNVWERVACHTTTDKSTAAALTYAALAHHDPQQRINLLNLACSKDANHILATCFRDALHMGRFDHGFQAMMWAASTVRRQIAPSTPTLA